MSQGKASPPAGPGTSQNPKERPKMDGKATYHGLYIAPKEVHPRYPNYIPELRAQRESTTKQDIQRSEVRRRQIARDHAEEMAMNRIVLNKVKRIAYPPTHNRAQRDHRLFGILPPTTSKHVTHAREVLSIFRCPPNNFTDIDSPLLQLDLISHGPRPRMDKSDVTTSTLDSID